MRLSEPGSFVFELLLSLLWQVLDAPIPNYELPESWPFQRSEDQMAQDRIVKLPRPARLDTHGGIRS